jgi:hypothetical protein
MEAAESIFEGKFDNVEEEDQDVEMDASAQESKKKTRQPVSRPPSWSFVFLCTVTHGHISCSSVDSTAVFWESTIDT